MTVIEFKEQVFKKALESGCTAAEIYFSEGESFSVDVRQGVVDEYSVSKELGLNLRVEYDGKNGYAYTEALEDADTLVAKAIDNAKSVESSDISPMQGKCEYEMIEKHSHPIDALSEKEKIDLAISIEQKTLKRDPRVDRVESANCTTTTGRTCIYNTLGLDAESDDDISYTYVLPIMRDGEQVKNSMAFRSGGKAMEIDSLVDEAVAECALQFGAKTVPAGKYNIIIRNTAFVDLLTAFSPIFSADNAQKGLSLLANKEGEVIGSSLLTIVDDPLHPEAPRAFDAEGVPSVTKTVVENGVFKTLLYNLRTAKKAGCESTSNASRAGTSAPIDITPSVMYVKPGDKSYDELIAQLGNGLVITDMSGLHSGLNTVSGEFSLLSRGLLIEGGKVVRAVDQITVGGNFIELLKSIEAIGSDLRFGLPFGAVVGSPSILINDVIISGS